MTHQQGFMLWVASAISIAVGTLFMVSGGEKVIHFTAFAATLGVVGRHFLPLFPKMLVIGIACVVAVGELMLGILLVVGCARRVVAFVGVGTLLVFIAYLLVLAMSPELPDDCGCGQLATLLQASMDHVFGGILRNVALICLLLVLWRNPSVPIASSDRERV